MIIRVRTVVDDGTGPLTRGEAAQIGNPVRLSPGEEWTGMQTLVVED